MKFGWQFERGTDVFKDYILELYSQKKNAEDPVTRYLVKIMLNAFGGKFGMKDKFSTLKLIKKGEFKKYDKNYNISLFAEVNEDLMMIKYSGRINETLRKVYNEYSDYLSPLVACRKGGEGQASNTELRKLNRSRGTFSSIPIAAAMTAYARMSINKHKNIVNNLCIYSDTDSVILTKVLEPELIGPELGQFKL